MAAISTEQRTGEARQARVRGEAQRCGSMRRKALRWAALCCSSGCLLQLSACSPEMIQYQVLVFARSIAVNLLSGVLGSVLN